VKKWINLMRFLCSLTAKALKCYLHLFSPYVTVKWMAFPFIIDIYQLEVSAWTLFTLILLVYLSSSKQTSRQ
jgi:hypothetical protein